MVGDANGLADALVLKATYTEGQLALTPVLSVRTDDLGEYHLFWLPPGRYYILAGALGEIANDTLRRDGDKGFAKRISADGKLQHGISGDVTAALKDDQVLCAVIARPLRVCPGLPSGRPASRKTARNASW